MGCAPLSGGLPELREAIAQKVFRENGVSFDPKRKVLVTNGSIHGITNLTNSGSAFPIMLWKSMALLWCQREVIIKYIEQLDQEPPDSDFKISKYL